MIFLVTFLLRVVLVEFLKNNSTQKLRLNLTTPFFFGTQREGFFNLLKDKKSF